MIGNQWNLILEPLGNQITVLVDCKIFSCPLFIEINPLIKLHSL